MKARFEVSTEGMRALQEGREPWQLAKELISNAWDESTTVCKVTLKSLTPRTALLSVYDDGKGFMDIKDAWTLMAHTPKRLDPNVRGRFNIGEKEILSIAKNAIIRTSGKIISFPKSGGRYVKDNPRAFEGTQVDVQVSWGSNQVKDTIDNLKHLLPPKNITYTINGETVPFVTPIKTVEATLETVIQSAPNEPIKPTRRKTQVEIYNHVVKGTLYELGIPIQTIDCQYSVNVLQKVPLPPNRDVVRDSYLQDIYVLVLNTMASEIQSPSDIWVRIGIEDKEAEPEAIKTVMNKRYGDKVALWSTDYRSNEKAMLDGYEIVHPKTLSPEERKAMAQVGLVHTSDIFPTEYKQVDFIPEEQWTSSMHNLAGFAKRLHTALIGTPLTVAFYNDTEVSENASYGNRGININLGRLGKNWCDTIDASAISLLLHEFAHCQGVGHEPSYYQSLETLSGKAVCLALAQPELFAEAGVKHTGLVS